MGHQQLKGRQGRPRGQPLRRLLLLNAQRLRAALPGAELPGAGGSQWGRPSWRCVGADAVAQLDDGGAQSCGLVARFGVGLGDNAAGA